MKLYSTKIMMACTFILATNVAAANPATSEKHAIKATELRQAVFKLLGANMGTLGAMAKGKIPFDAKVIEKNATRINQLSFMIDDYTATDTSAYKVKTEALAKVWNEREAFEKRIKNLSLASDKLIKIAASGDEKAMRAAIGGVGKTCGGCHDDFKEDK
ncbi:c-type cytochrome [Colwellia sp. E150_009]|jgi:cytochrome c556